MCTVRPACRKSPAWRAIYSGALPTVGTDATVIEDPGGACVTADELPEVWQPASSMAAATPHPATRARARLQRHTGPQPACTTFITPQRRAEQISAIQDIQGTRAYCTGGMGGAPSICASFNSLAIGQAGRGGHDMVAEPPRWGV